MPWDLGDIGACWQQGSAPREPLPDVPLGTRLLPPALVNRMWSHPNPGVPVPRPSPATPRGSSSGAAVPVPPSPRSGTGRARGRRCWGPGQSLGRVPCPGGLRALHGRGSLVPPPVLAPCERAAGGGHGHQGTPAHHLPPPGCSPARVSLPTALHLFLVSLPPPGPSLSSWQAMGHGGVLAAPEDPEERRGAQGEGAHPCPPECQELTAVPTPQAVSARGARDHGCPHCHPHGCPRGCPQGGGQSPGVAVSPLSSHP